MFALNFYSELYGDALKRGRKSASIRLGDKTDKYQTGQIVWVTVGPRYSRRKKLFCAIVDASEVKPIRDLSPRDIQRENPEFHTIEDVTGLLSRIYAREVTEDDTVTVIYFSPVDEYEL